MSKFVPIFFNWQREQQVREVLQADNSVRILLAESDVRDKKINELAAKLHSAEQQQKAAMQTVTIFTVNSDFPIQDYSYWALNICFPGTYNASALGNGISTKRGEEKSS